MSECGVFTRGRKRRQLARAPKELADELWELSWSFLTADELLALVAVTCRYWQALVTTSVLAWRDVCVNECIVHLVPRSVPVQVLSTSVFVLKKRFFARRFAQLVKLHVSDSYFYSVQASTLQAILSQLPRLRQLHVMTTAERVQAFWQHWPVCSLNVRDSRQNVDDWRWLSGSTAAETLKELHLAYHHLNHEALRVVCQLPRLSHLGLYYQDWPADTVSLPAGLALTQLYIVQCNVPTLTFLRHFPQLRVLMLSELNLESDDELVVLRSLSQLRTLDLTCSSWLTDRGLLQHVLPKADQLTQLVLQDCFRVSARAVRQLSRRCKVKLL